MECGLKSREALYREKGFCTSLHRRTSGVFFFFTSLSFGGVFLVFTSLALLKELFECEMGSGL